MAMTLPELNKRYGTDEDCREILTRLRWPKASRARVARIARSGNVESASNSRAASAATNSLSRRARSSMILTCLWPRGSWLFYCWSRLQGISANQIKRTLGISYKTAWYLCHRIRAAMLEAKQTALDGKIEMDETYIGGKSRGRGFSLAAPTNKS